MTVKYPWLTGLHTQLSQQYQTNQLHHALLINAAVGMGKRQFAMDFAAGLLCDKKTGQACGQCKSCLLLETQAHPDFFIAEDPAAKSIGVDLIRQVVSRAQQKSQQGGALVFYIPDCDKMTEASANALLKTLEEPGQDKYLILTTASINRLLPTILSRCQQYVLRPPQLSELTSWLAEQNVDLARFETIYQQMNGSPLIALDYAKSDYLDKQKAFLAEFKQLITGQISAFQFSQIFDEKAYNQQLDWLNQAISKWLAAKLQSNSSDPKQAVKRLLISDLNLQLAHARAQMLQSGMNKKTIFQRLCFNLVDGLKH